MADDLPQSPAYRELAQRVRELAQQPTTAPEIRDVLRRHAELYERLAAEQLAKCS